MRTCAPWSRLVAELPDYDDRLLANSQLMANDQRPYERRLWSLQRVRPGAGCIATSRSLLLAWQRYRRPHPRCGANKFSAGSIAVSRTGLGAASGRLDPVGGGEYCDGYTYENGSYDHCVSVTVLGFGGTKRNRVCPPDPANPAVPLYRGNPVYPARSTCSSKSLNP
jgi:hypothetical protein